MAEVELTIRGNAVRIADCPEQLIRACGAAFASPEEGVASSDTGPERALSAKQAVSWLEAAMLKLPLEQREALILCAVDGLELADAAEALDVSVDTVKTRLRRARLALVEARARLHVRAEREESR